MVVSTPKLITAKEASEALGVSTRTLLNLRTRGEISSIRVGGQVKYDPADVQAYIARNRTEAKGAAS